MPPSRGMSCEPVFSGDDAFAPNGEIQLEVSHTSGNSNRSAGYEGAENDYSYDAETDQYHFVGVSDEQMSVDPHSSGFNEEAYLNAMVEADPVISEAIQWGTNNLPAEQINRYNEVVENTDDLEELHKAVNWMVDSYNAAMLEQNNFDAEAEEDDYDEPLGTSTELANYYAEEAQVREQEGDIVLSDILEQMAVFSAGEMSQADLQNSLSSRYDVEEIEAAFARM